MKPGDRVRILDSQVNQCSEEYRRYIGMVGTVVSMPYSCIAIVDFQRGMLEPPCFTWRLEVVATPTNDNLPEEY